MRSAMRVTAAGLALSLMCGGGPAKTATRETVTRDGVPTHCTAEEEVVQACVLEGSPKVMSLCMSRGASVTQGYLQYRFGKPGALELEFPKDRGTPPGRAFERRVVLHPPGGSSHYAFTNEGTRYEIWSVSHAGEEAAGIKILLPKGGPVALSCGATAYGRGPSGLPNQAVLEIKAAARAVLAALDQSPSCGGEQREEWSREARSALEMDETDAVMVQFIDSEDELLTRLKSMTCEP